MMWRVSALLLLFSAALGADTYPRQPGIDVLHYVFRLRLGDQSNEISGETTITVKFLRDAVAGLDLDLTSKSIGTGMTVLTVRRGDRKSTRLNSSHVSESRMPSSA